MGGFRRARRAAVAAGLATAVVAGSVSAAATPVHRWQANGDATDSVADNDGTLKNGATALGTPAEGTYSFGLDGVDDYVEMPDASTHYFTGSFSVAAWVSTSDATGTQALVTKNESVGSGAGSILSLYRLFLADGKPFALVRDADGDPDNSGQELGGPSSIADGDFHEMLLVRDVDADLISLYVDGKLVSLQALDEASGAISNLDAEADPLQVGARFNAGTTTPIEFFTGLIDDVQLFSSAAFQADLLDAITLVKAKNLGGDFTDLHFADAPDNVLTLKSKRAGSFRLLRWEGSFTQIPDGVGDFTIHYDGSTSRMVKRKIRVFNPATNKFECPDPTPDACVMAKGQSSIDINGSNLAQYAGTDDVVRVRIQGKSRRGFTETSDSLVIAYES